jgi:hypothetical protein
MNLEYKVELKKEDELKTLYTWYINEIDQDGNVVKKLLEKFIPYRWRISFKIKNINFVTDIGLENETQEFDEDTGFDKVGESFEINRGSRIYGNLKIDEHDYDTELSMFGTNRKIEDISINIYKSEEEYCRVWGSPEYSTEINFRNHTIPDCLEISLGLKEDDYLEIAERIKDKSINSYSISLKNVNGFYSPWTPETSTPEIKVLTKDHEIKIPENTLPDDYELPRLGNVGGFDMVSVFTYELINDKKVEDDDIDEPVNFNVPLSTGERLQEETKQELSKLISLIEKQQKYVYWGFLILIFIIIGSTW